jgi:hypothetical protein
MDDYNGRARDAVAAAVQAVQRSGSSGETMDPSGVEALVEGWTDVS